MYRLSNYLLLFVTVLSIFSCSSDIKIPSKLSMQVGVGYTSTSTVAIVVGLNKEVKVGIIASKLEANTLLSTFTVSNLFNDATTANIYYTEKLTGANANAFNKDFTFKTRGVVGTEKWIFSVTNTDGITNQVYIVLDVQNI